MESLPQIRDTLIGMINGIGILLNALSILFALSGDIPISPAMLSVLGVIGLGYVLGGTIEMLIWDLALFSMSIFVSFQSSRDRGLLPYAIAIAAISTALYRLNMLDVVIQRMEAMFTNSLSPLLSALVGLMILIFAFKLLFRR